MVIETGSEPICGIVYTYNTLWDYNVQGCVDSEHGIAKFLIRHQDIF